MVNECVQKCLVYITAMHDKKLRFFLSFSVSSPSHPECTYSVNIGSRDHLWTLEIFCKFCVKSVMCHHGKISGVADSQDCRNISLMIH